jgi:hypothetical protein
MNRNAATTKAMDITKRRSSDAFWTGEWSFIEDGDVALQKVARSFAGKQTVANHCGASSSSLQTESGNLV